MDAESKERGRDYLAAEIRPPHASAVTPQSVALPRDVAAR